MTARALAAALTVLAFAAPAHADEATPTKAEGIARCRKGELPACTYAGQLSRDEGNFTEALAYMVRGCAAAYEDGCTVLGELYLHGTGKLTKSQLHQAIASTTAACTKGEARACYLQGQAERGAVGVDDLKLIDAANARAFRAFDRGCDGAYAAACDALADVYLGGFGVARDPAKAKAYWQRACKFGDQHACTAASLDIQ